MIRRLALPAALAVALAGLPAVRAVAATSSTVPPANTGLPPEAAPPPPSPPLPDSQRLPVPTYTEEVGGGPAAEQVIPEGDTAREAVADATLSKPDGGPNYDVYTTGGAEHLAVVYPQTVNYEAPNGDWKDLTDQISSSADGWTTSRDGLVVTIPTELSEAGGVRYELPEGSLTTSPTGLLQPVAGQRDGRVVTYPRVRPDTDYVYTFTDTGYKEAIVLRSPVASGELSWTVRADGLTLAPGPAGQVAILTAGTQIGSLSTPVARDSSPERAETASPLALTDLGSGTYKISALIDPAFLAEATYPVTIDPQPQNDERRPEKDTYTNQDQPTNDYATNGLLRIQNNSGQQKHTFLKFNTDNLTKDDRLVYDAELYLLKDTTSGSDLDIEARRVDEPWAETITWNQMPTVGGVFDGRQQADGDWRYWDLEDLYQHYIQTGYPGHWQDYGVRLSSDAGSADFFSSDNTQWANNSGDPKIYLAWNDLPAKPVNLLSTDNFVESPSPKLQIGAVPNDPNGDKVYVRFQLATDPAFGQSDLVFTGPWLKEQRSYVLPSGVLTDGQTYYWRAQAKDPFPLTDGSGILRQPSTSDETESFTASFNHYGSDERWAMWSRTIGNDAEMKVNEASGNLFLDVPLDTVSTPIDDLQIGLVFNSAQREKMEASGNDYGLGPGWDFAIGPASSGADLPIELEKISPQPEGGVKIRMRGGRTQYFPHRDGRVYGGMGAGSGEVRRDTQGKFTYKDPEGGRYFFSSNGNLTDAAPAATKGSANNARLSYSYVDIQPGGSGPTFKRLKRVTDTLGREVTLFWDTSATPRVDQIKMWDAQGTQNARVWSLSYAGDRITKIDGPIADQDLSFAYDADQRLGDIRDGELTYENTQGTADASWAVSYWTDPKGNARVSTITPPGITPPATSPPTDPGYYWYFAYPTGPANYYGTTAKWTKITDPEGSNSATVDDRLTMVDFNAAGLPLRIEGPADQAGNRPITRMVWDSNDNMICKRTPAANAVAEGAIPDSGPNETDETQSCLDENLTTVYDYAEEEPYRMVSSTGPAPNADGTGPRQTTTYTYDSGTSFQGLWGEIYNNKTLEGFPDAEYMWTDFDKNWGSGSPPGAGGGGGNDWSVRMTGYLDLSGETAPKDYEFKVFAADGVAVTIGDKTLVDCYGEPVDPGTDLNCDGRSIVEKTLYPGLKPVTIEYSALGGSAHFTLKWDKGLDNGADNPTNFTVMQKTDFGPNLGLLTKKTTTVDTNRTKKQTWSYQADDAKARELAESETVTDVEGQAGSEARTTDFEYNTFGQVTKTTVPGISITENTYTNGTSPAGWAEAGVQVSCLSKSVVREPGGQVVSTTDSECDASGNVRRTETDVPAVSGRLQPAADRVTVTTYDELGRVAKRWNPATGSQASPDVSYTYDRSGRTLTEARLIDGTQVATTSSVYDLRGNLTKQTGPDPDGAGSETAAISKFAYNKVDNQTRKTDPRDPACDTAFAATCTTTTTFDQQNRAVQITGPDPSGSAPSLITTSTYSLQTAGAYDNKITTTPPTGVASTKRFDVLGRKSTDWTGTLNPTDYFYDQSGQLTKVTGPDPDLAGQTAYPRIDATTSYNIFGQALQTKNYAGTADEAVTTNTYDAGGRLVTTDGPRSANDSLSYTYDAAGKLTSATLNGITTPGTSTAQKVSVEYNGAGERIWMKIPMEQGKDLVRQWAYDGAGRLQTFADYPSGPGAAANSTTYVYNGAGWPIRVNDPRTADDLCNVYDNLGRLTDHFRGVGSGCGQKNTISDRETFRYDKLGNKIEAKSYNAAGTTVASTTTMTYDTYARLSSVVSGSNTTTYSYDPAKGQLTSLADPAGTSTYTYEANGLLDQLNDPITSGYLDYDYDGAGRVITRKETATGGSGLVWTRAYEANTGRIDTQSIKKASTTLVSSDLGYDKAGNVTAKTQAVSGTADNWTYSYDPAGQMSTAQLTGTGGYTMSYGYDGARNRTSVQKNSTTPTKTTYDQAGGPTGSDNGTAATADDIVYRTDELGSVTKVDYKAPTFSQIDFAFDYDAWGRMSKATSGVLNAGLTGFTSTTATLTYTPDGLSRTLTKAKTVGSTTTNTTYAYSGLTEDFAKVTDTATSTFTYSPGGPIAQKVGNTSREYLRDLHGDVVGTTDLSGVLKGVRTYDPWGEVRGTPTGDGTSFKVGFQGDPQDYDKNATLGHTTGLVDMTTRYYLPSLGRFTTRDALFGDPLDPASLNQFVYGQDSPVTFWDPLGMRVAIALGGGEPGPSEPGHHHHSSTTSPSGYSYSYATDSSGATAAIYHFPIAKLPKVGLVRGGFFIKTGRVQNQTPTIPFAFDEQPDLLGDDRGFDPYASSEDFRVFIRLNYRTGRGGVRVNPTCEAESGVCQSALHFGDGNRANVTTSAGGRVRLDYSFKNSVLDGLLLRPAIAGDLEVRPSRKGVVGKPRYDMLNFPSFELYQQRGDVRRTVWQASEGSPYALVFAVHTEGSIEF